MSERVCRRGRDVSDARERYDICDTGTIRSFTQRRRRIASEMAMQVRPMREVICQDEQKSATMVPGRPRSTMSACRASKERRATFAQNASCAFVDARVAQRYERVSAYLMLARRGVTPDGMSAAADVEFMMSSSCFRRDGGLQTMRTSVEAYAKSMIYVRRIARRCAQTGGGARGNESKVA